MAIATSSLHRGFSGATGDFIFRTYNGKTIVSLRPVYRNETNTEARRVARERFQEATFYAHDAMERVKERSYYKQKAKQLGFPNGYTAAITDYLRKVKARVITRSSFSARKGDVVYIGISKYPFRVSRILVRSCNDRGETLAEQTLCKALDDTRFPPFVFEGDLPGFAGLKIITDEPSDKEYLVPLSDFYWSPVL
jgi:hypothetical protein